MFSKPQIYLRLFLISAICLINVACSSHKTTNISTSQTNQTTNASQNNLSSNPNSNHISAFRMETYLPREALEQNNEPTIEDADLGGSCEDADYSVIYLESQVQDAESVFVESPGIKVTEEDNNDELLDLSKFETDTPGRYLVLESGVDCSGTLDSDIMLCITEAEEACVEDMGNSCTISGNCRVDLAIYREDSDSGCSMSYKEDASVDTAYNFGASDDELSSCTLSGVRSIYGKHTTNTFGLDSDGCSDPESPHKTYNWVEYKYPDAVFTESNPEDGTVQCDGSCNTVDPCDSHADKTCYNDDVYWYDSCGNRESIYDDCSPDETCSNGNCISTNDSDSDGDGVDNDYDCDPDNSASWQISSGYGCSECPNGFRIWDDDNKYCYDGYGSDRGVLYISGGYLNKCESDMEVPVDFKFCN